ncbi:hypothetical protein ACN38_g12755, partial [Penicillium nordicum]
ERKRDYLLHKEDLSQVGPGPQAPRHPTISLLRSLVDLYGLTRRYLNPPNMRNKNKKHTTVRIRWWSPTQLLTHRRVA